MEQSGRASLHGRPWADLSLIFHAAPAEDGLAPLDELRIHGRHDVVVQIPGGIRPAAGIAALLVNSIPGALNAAPGYHLPGSLPAPRPWLGSSLGRLPSAQPQ